MARVLVIGPDRRVLLLDATDGSTGARFWLTPGGGVEATETFQDAARRELREETGLVVADVGPCVWTRRHRYAWAGRTFDQYERFFVVTTTATTIAPANPDAYVRGHRWWSMAELRASNEHFAPRQFAHLIEPIVSGRYPTQPIDCDV